MLNGIKLPSGHTGWRARLREVYGSAEEFEAWDGCYGLLERLKFASVAEAWEADPIIQGGTNPADYGVVKLTPGPWRWWDEPSASRRESGVRKMVHRMLLGPAKGQFVMDTTTVTINGELEQVHITVRPEDEPTLVAAPLLRETLRRVQSNLQLILDAMVPPGIDGTIKLLKLAVDVADGVEDPAKLAAMFEE